MAVAQNLAAIAITDHDTVEGSKEAQQTGIPPQLKFVTGVEMSTAPLPSIACDGSLHILGYCINLNDPALNKALGLLQTARENRNPQIVERLNHLGFNVSLDGIRKDFGKSQLGRPHIAQYMVQQGYASSIDDAFDRYLGRGKPAYVDKYRIACHQAIDIIRAAGGVAVLAHPYLLGLDQSDQLENAVVELIKLGLGGIEVYYPEHPPEKTEFYAYLAEKYNLVKTGGTDFHGQINPEIRMGCGRGDLHIPYSVYESLIFIP
jgi:predicted metal-dependent phosphoesterase TrpH